MKFHYYPDTDSLYIDLLDKPGVETQEVSPGIILDFDEKKNLVGIDIDRASARISMSSLETVALPIVNLSMSQGEKVG